MLNELIQIPRPKLIKPSVDPFFDKVMYFYRISYLIRVQYLFVSSWVWTSGMDYHILSFQTLTRTGSFHGCCASLYGKVYGYHYISYCTHVTFIILSFMRWHAMALWNSNFRSKCMADIELTVMVVKRKIILNKLNIKSR